MGSNYLKALQLSKQLEQRAKEATQNLQLAEKEIHATEEAIRNAKKIEATTAKSEALLEEAKQALDKKDYKGALEKATLAKQETENARDERIETVISSATTLLVLAADLGSKAANAEDALKKAKEAVEKGEFEAAVNHARDSWEESNKVLHEKVSEIFSAAQSLLVLAESAGEEVGHLQDRLDEAKGAIDEGDYKVALEAIRETLETAGTRLADTLNERIEDAQAELDTAEENGIRLGNSQKLIEEAREAVTSGEFELAIKNIDKAKDAMGGEFKDHVRNRMDETKKHIRAAAEMDADMDEANDYLDEAKAALKKKEYKSVMDLLEKAEEVANNAQFQRVLKTISLSRNKFIAAKKIGADITKAVTFLNKARDRLKENDFQGALKYAQKSDDEIDKVVKSYQIAQEEIESLQHVFEDAEELGVDTAKAQNLIERARGSLEEMRFDKALDLIKRSREETERAEYDRVMEVIENTEMALTICEKMGINTEDLSEILEESISALKDKRFKDAATIASQGKEEAEKLMEIRINRTIESAEATLVAETFIDTAPAKEKLEAAKAALENRDFENAYTLSNASQELIITTRDAKVRGSLDEADAAVREALELGADVFVASEFLEKAKLAMQDGDFQKVVDFTKSCMVEVDKSQKQAVGDLFNSAKEAAIEAQKAGIDIARIKKKLQEAKTAFEKQDYTNTLRKSKEAKDEAKTLIQRRKVTEDILKEAASEIAEANKKRIDIKGPAQKIVQAKKLFEASLYDKAEELARSAREEMEKIMSQYTSAKIIITNQKKLALGKKLKLNIKDANAKLTEAKGLMKNKKYDESLELAKECEALLDSVLGESILHDINGLEKAIVDAKGLGLNTVSAADLLAEAKANLERKKFGEALKVVETCHNEIDTIRDLSQKVAKSIQKAQMNISDGENINADMKEAKELVTKALASLKNNDYQAALEFAEKANEISGKEQEVRVTKVISFFEAAISKTKKDNINTTQAESLIERARAAMGENRYKDALNLAMQSESELERADLQHKMATESIETARTKIKELENTGIRSPECVAMLDKAETAFGKGDYVKALELAVQTGEKVHHIREEFREADRFIQEARTRITQLYKEGVDITTAKEIFTQAKDALDSKDFPKAMEMAKLSIEEAGRGQSAHTGKSLNEAEGLLKQAEAMQLDVAEPKAALEEGHTALDAGETIIALQKAGEAEFQLEDILTKKLNEMVAQTNERILGAKDLGGDTGKAERLLAKAQGLIGEKKFLDAKGLLDQADESVGGTKDVAQALIDMTYQADSLIATAKKYGLPVKKAQKLLEEAVGKKDSDPDAAMELATKARDDVQALMDTLNPDLSTDIAMDDLVKGKWAEVELTITNNGKALAKDISLEVEGDVEVKELKTIKTLRGGAEEKLNFKLKPTASGTVEMILTVKAEGVIAGREHEFKEAMDLEVEQPKEAKKGFTKMTAEASAKCGVCKGKIKKGMTVIQCGCGEVYHEPCANRAGKCPKCGTSIKHEVAKKKLALKIG